MEDYIRDLASMSAISEPPKYFWLWHFRAFLTYDDRLMEMDFNTQIDVFLSVPPFRLLYGDHIVRDLDTGDVIASRCPIYMDNVDLDLVQSQVDAWVDQREVTTMQQVNQEGSDEKFFFIEPDYMYIWEVYSETVDELIATTIMGVITVSVIGFVLMPHWSATPFLFPIIAILYIDLIGTPRCCLERTKLLLYLTKQLTSLTRLRAYCHYRIPSIVSSSLEPGQLLCTDHEHRFTCGLQHASSPSLLRITVPDKGSES